MRNCPKRLIKGKRKAPVRLMVNRMKTYKINVNVKDPDIVSGTLEFLENCSFIPSFCLVEGRPETLNPFNIVVFDDESVINEGVIEYCSTLLRFNSDTIFLHVSECPFKSTSLHIVGMTKEQYLNNFIRVLGFCFLTHCVKSSFGSIIKLTE